MDERNKESADAQLHDNQKSVRRIIALWKEFASDPDPLIRAMTLLATVVGFIALILLSVLIVDNISRFGNNGPSGSRITTIVVYGLLALGFSFVGISTPVALRLSTRVSSRVLAEGFDNVYRQRYGHSVAPSEADRDG